MRERAECCRTCASWKPPELPHEDGECWSGDRLDGDMTKGPAGYSFPWRVCEAWMPKIIAHSIRREA